MMLDFEIKELPFEIDFDYYSDAVYVTKLLHSMFICDYASPTVSKHELIIFIEPDVKTDECDYTDEDIIDYIETLHREKYHNIHDKVVYYVNTYRHSFAVSVEINVTPKKTSTEKRKTLFDSLDTLPYVVYSPYIPCHNKKFIYGGHKFMVEEHRPNHAVCAIYDVHLSNVAEQPDFDIYALTLHHLCDRFLVFKLDNEYRIISEFQYRGQPVNPD